MVFCKVAQSFPVIHRCGRNLKSSYITFYGNKGMYFEPEISFLFGWTFSIICAILAEGTAVTRMPKFADWKREAVNYKITAVRYWEGLSQFLPEQFRYL